MASARKGTEKRHNPVESICRKIRAIQKREVTSYPVQQIIKYQSRSFDSPQTNTQKNFEEVLWKMTAAHLPTLNSHFSSSEKVDNFISSPQIVSPRTPSIAHLSSPEDATYSVILSSSESISTLRSQSNQNYTSLISHTRNEDCLSNKDLNNYCSERNFRTLALDFDSASGQSSDFFTPKDSVVKKLSLHEDEWKLGTDDGKDGTYSINTACEEELLTRIFHACSVGVAKIIDYLRQTTSQDSEVNGLEELWNMIDPEKRDPHVDLETFHAVMKEWMAYCRNKREGVNSGLSGILNHSVFGEQDSIKPGGAIKMITDIRDSASGSFEALGGDMSKGVLEVPDLITYVADLYFNKQKLEEENSKFKLALETLEEANNHLTEDCTDLRLQVKSAHQSIMRTNLLKEELEELKISMNASEEQKTTIASQNKQLETENRDLILKIRILQEENIKNIMDIDRLEKKIEELSRTETEQQMQLQTYENTLLNKDASLQKKDLSIEELKSTIVEYGSIIENLRGEKNKLAHELQHLQQELIVNGIQLKVSEERKGIISEGEKSLHYELTLAQSAENNETEWQCNLTNLSSLDMMMDQEMLLSLREPEQKGVEFTAVLWKLEFKHIMEEKLNLFIIMLNSLENHRESLDKEFVKLIEILKRCRLEYFGFREELLSSQKQVEAIKQLQEDAVNQEALLRKQLQEASQRLEVAEEQVKDRDQAAHSANKKAESLQHKLEEAISEQRNLQTINTELSNACQTLERQTRRLKTTIDLLQKKLIQEGLHGLLSQNFLDEEFPHYDHPSCTGTIQQPLQEKLMPCVWIVLQQFQGWN
ncbi:PREDICTED: lymphoid-restricted membrane protein-like [Galeopterus variegatus]|uniref:Lymphoid-restricted membrane protein-like n=1 Tax=Galeopterus variegatus TaxID=482537 RepID=A0ABM0RMN2_GALVR|nr:PREDICTED: lymphoid-restricted membrane protein-like [Galeopterus variegatus]